MSIKTWFHGILKKETQQAASIPIYRVETPDKIIETKIHPIKMPTIFDVSERLFNISHDISVLKNEIVTKMWFKNEFEDISPTILDKLSDINNNLKSLQENFNNFASKLSNFTKDNIFFSFSDVDHFNTPLNTSEFVFDIVKKHKKIRYKDIITRVPISDPTLSKYLKFLVSNKKIRRTKVGKAVFYETI